MDYSYEVGFRLSSQGYWQIPEIHWDFSQGKGIPYYTYRYGAQVANVRVNQINGTVKVEKIWATHDGGKILFPKGPKGYCWGGEDRPGAAVFEIPHSHCP